MSTNALRPGSRQLPIAGDPRQWTVRLTAEAALLAAVASSLPAAAAAQDNPYTAALLAAFEDETMAQNAAVEGADSSRVAVVLAVLQIRFANRWIMVDAGVDSAGTRQFAEAPFTFRAARYDSIQTALRDAEHIVLTHEHYDHALGVQRGPYFRQVAARTLLTPEQRQSPLEPPGFGYVAMAKDSVAMLGSHDYKLISPLAPGVALIKAPGHTPGAQFVYVHLENGRELLLVGDLMWAMAGLTTNHQKPAAVSEAMKENRTFIQWEMDWVRSLMAAGTIVVIPAHDKQRFESLAAGGILREGLDLRRQ